jgi:hypothetical protein
MGLHFGITPPHYDGERDLLWFTGSFNDPKTNVRPNPRFEITLEALEVLSGNELNGELQMIDAFERARERIETAARRLYQSGHHIPPGVFRLHEANFER